MNRYSIITTDTTGHTMLKIKYTFPEDIGEYTCRARNNAGEAVTIAHLIPEGSSHTYLHLIVIDLCT